MIILYHFSEICAAETASNKQTSSKSCALSLVRQLYHLNVIEPFTGITKKDKEAEPLPAFNVALDPPVINDVFTLLTDLEVEPVDPEKFKVLNYFIMLKYVNELQFEKILILFCLIVGASYSWIQCCSSCRP